MQRLSGWVAMISGTGSELVSICNYLNILPDKLVFTNKLNIFLGNYHWFKYNDVDFVKETDDRNIFDKNDDFMQSVDKNTFFTLHGYMKIIKPEVCDSFEGRIFNGHPGLITKYPELKGKNPQKKAFDLNHNTIGSVIHKVTSKLDSGPIILEEEDFVGAHRSIGQFMVLSRLTSLKTWIRFFTEPHIYNVHFTWKPRSWKDNVIRAYL